MFRFENPVIAAVRSKEEFLSALSSPVDVVFLLKSTINDLKEAIDAKNSSGKQLFLHADMCDGLGKDKAGMQYLSALGMDGIISTRTNVIAAAKAAGLITVQRFFIIDSASVHTALESLITACPDCVEIMPGTLLPQIEFFRKNAKNMRLIAGGLIENKEQMVAALSAGADGVSVGKKELWFV